MARTKVIYRIEELHHGAWKYRKNFKTPQSAANWITGYLKPEEVRVIERVYVDNNVSKEINRLASLRRAVRPLENQKVKN